MSLEVIERWDMKDVRRKFVQHIPTSVAELDRIEREYKRYMVMLHQNPGIRFPMPHLLDEFAHTHFIFLGNFRKFQEEALEMLMEHTPCFTTEEEQALLPDYHGLTLETYQQTFGENPPEDLWPRERCVCLHNGNPPRCTTGVH